MNKNLLRILVVVGLGALIAAGFYFYNLKKHPRQQQQQFSVDKKVLAASQLPKGFPSNLPVEAGSTILQNYEATANDGRLQSTRVMTTKKTLAQAVKIYSDFYSKLGWDIVPTTNPDDNTVEALLRKGNDTALIVAKNNGDQKTVEITLTQAPK
jgi:hypothetical protein